MTAVMDPESSKHTLTRRVSFSEQPPAVHETEHDELEELFPRACDHVDSLKSLSHGETCVIHLYVSKVIDGGSVCPAVVLRRPRRPSSFNFYKSLTAKYSRFSCVSAFYQALR
jgi:hypothetical protein